MKKKLLSQTYLKGVNKYELKLIDDNDEYFLCIKRIIEIDIPFITSNNLFLINNGYYIVEVLPKNENYAMRVFFNEKKEILHYYFDITLENGIDEETRIPYYIDLYLDVTFHNDKINVLDENELKAALDEEVITKEQFDLANKTKDLLIESLKNGKNKYLNIDIEKYI